MKTLLVALSVLVVGCASGSVDPLQDAGTLTTDIVCSELNGPCTVTTDCCQGTSGADSQICAGALGDTPTCLKMCLQDLDCNIGNTLANLHCIQLIDHNGNPRNYGVCQ